VKEKNSIIYIKELLDAEAKKRDDADEVSKDKLDPILVAKRYKDSNISLICNPPLTSISNKQCLPIFQIRYISDLRVP